MEQVRQRFRTTLEIDADHATSFNGDMPAFWEDSLFGVDEGSMVRFRIGEVHFEGSNPCARCPVPSRDPQTAAIIADFQKRFSQLRQAQLPPWAPTERFDHFYRLATNTRVASTQAGKLLRVGAPLTLA